MRWIRRPLQRAEARHRHYVLQWEREGGLTL